jgi:endonuclease YncB( thermonuclease family)
MRTLLLTVALLVPIFAQAQTITGKIVSVSDGDTVTLLDSSNTQYKIRLAGVDSPEKKQAYGNKSKENLSNLVFGKTVDAECSKKDRYQRLICKIIVDGIDANLQQIKDGFAWHYKAYQKEQSATDRQVYADAEEVAREARKGLWVEAEPQAPWEFRKKLKFEVNW